MVKSLIASEVPVDKELTGQLGSVGVRLRSVSLQSCTVEHEKQVRVSSDMKLVIRMEGTSHTVPVKVLRSRIGMVTDRGTGYHTTLELVQVPDEVKALIERFIRRRSSEGAGSSSEQGIRA